MAAPTGTGAYGDATIDGNARVHQGHDFNHSTNTYIYNIQNLTTADIRNNTDLPIRPLSSSDGTKPRTSPHTKYQYARINADAVVRLLTLYCGGQEPDILEVSFRYVRVDELRNFEYHPMAFSWSAVEGPRVPLHVRPSNSYLQPNVKPVDSALRSLGIHPNLDLALRKLRATMVPNAPSLVAEFLTYLWIDSICIDENNSEERKQQSIHLPLIFGCGNYLLVWPGPGTEELDRAASFITQVSKAPNFEHLIAGDPGLARCKAFLHLMKNPLFSNRSLVMELALSRHAYLFCGGLFLSWLQFADAVDSFVQNFDKVQLQARYSRNYAYDFLENHIEGLAVVPLVHQVGNVMRFPDTKSLPQPLMNLETLMTTFVKSVRSHETKFQASFRPLIQIAKPETCNDISEDLPIDEQLHRFAAGVIRRTRSLDIVCQPWAIYSLLGPHWPKTKLGETHEKASWIRSIGELPFGIDDDKRMSRINGDPLVPMGSGRSAYKASNDRKARWSFADWYDRPGQANALTSAPKPSLVKSSNGGSPLMPQWSIRVDGLQIGSIQRTSEAIAEGVVPCHVLQKLGWSPSNKTSIPDKLLSILVADRGPDGQSFPASYRSACRKAFEHISPNGHLNTARLLDRLPQDNVRVFLKRVQAVVWNRRYFEVMATDKRHGALHGWGPPYVQPGDFLCILFGCTVPCFLRKQSGKESYRLIGEAYVYGCMDGEAVSVLTEEEVEAKKVEWVIN